MEINVDQAPEVNTEPLKLLNSIKINDQLTVNYYEHSDGTLIGLEHYSFDKEILFKEKTAAKMVEVIQLLFKNKEITEKIKGLSSNQETI